VSERYARQTVLPEIGAAGQERLARARVVIVGCGGLGSPVAAYLAGAGVGNIRLVDGDTVSLSNLHRQVFFEPGRQAGKANQLAEHCRRLNEDIRVVYRAEYLEAGNVRALLGGADLVIDCTDDAATKHRINDACVQLNLPFLYGAAQGYAGYVALFPTPGSGIHLRDVYPEPDPNLPDCATAGVLPTAVGIVALLQANAALCFLLSIGDPPIDTLLTYHALDNRQFRIRLTKTYRANVPVPWSGRGVTRHELEVKEASLTPAGYTGVFSMLSEEREPDLPPAVRRLSNRDPLGQCLAEMKEGGRYLLYCNSGKLSLILAAQIRKHLPGVEVFSLSGGLEGLAQGRLSNQ
jgi:adenylyltransferase/sulfurtransferase